MGSPDGTKIALGLLASTSALIISYILFKKYGFKSKATHTKLEEREDEFHEPLQEATNEYEFAQDKTEKELTEGLPQEKGPVIGSYDNEGGDDGQNQTSFVVLDDIRGAAPLEGDNGTRKSDKSSDESSYDVVEDERIVEMEEVNNEEEVVDENASATGPLTAKSAGDRPDLESSLETSMVMVEEAERSGIEKSGSSFYTSADENFGVMPLEDSTKLEKESERDDMIKSDQALMEMSVTEDEETVMYKSGSLDNESVTLEGKDSGNDVTPVVEELVVPSSEESENTELQEHIDDPAVQAKLESHAITDAVLRANLDTSPPEAAPKEAVALPQGEEELNMAEVTETLSKCQSTPMKVTKEDVDMLVHLMRKNMPELQATVLNSIVRIAAFNQNTKNIRESGCPEEIVYQLRTNCEAFANGEDGAEALLTSICQVLTNLSMDPKAHPKLEESIPNLINLLVQDLSPESLILTTLRPLINLSAEPTYHAYYVRAIPTLLAQLDAGSNMAKVQSLKVLVNLSLDEDMVPHILAVKAPFCLMSLFAPPTQNDVILRTVTMLANVFATMSEKKLELDALPTGQKSESSESMFETLNDTEQRISLRSKVFRLTNNDDEDIRYQASKLYKHLSDTSDSSG